MSSPQEKANELYYNFYVGIGNCVIPFDTDALKNAAKTSALIAVDEILKASPSKPIESDNGSYSSDIMESIEYWQQVKTEIENL